MSHPKPTFADYVGWSINFHRLKDEGRGDDPECDATADLMDGPWYEGDLNRKTPEHPDLTTVHRAINAKAMLVWNERPQV